MLLAVTVALLATGFALWVMYSIAPRVDLLDHPTERRKIHGNPVPLIGGIAIFYGVLLASLALEPPNPQQWLFALLGGKVLVVVGVLDDHSGLGARVRLLGQTAAALLMTLGAGITLHSLGDLLGFGPIELGPLAVPFTVFAVVGIINAFNLVDGIDGLAGLLVLIALISLLVLEPVSVHAQTVLLMVCATLLPYLVCNLGLTRPERKVFLGDAGSMLLGYIVAWQLVKHSQSPWATIDPVIALWLVAIPLMDTLCVMTRRLRRGCSPFEADRCHLHYLLARLLGSQRQALLAIMLLASALAGFGVLGQLHGLDEALMFYLGLLLFLAYLAGLTLLPRLYRRAERRRRRLNGIVLDTAEKS